MVVVNTEASFYPACAVQVVTIVEEVGTGWGLDGLIQEKRACVLNLQYQENPLFSWCPGPDLNRHGGGPPRDFKSITQIRRFPIIFNVLNIKHLQNPCWNNFGYLGLF